MYTRMHPTHSLSPRQSESLHREAYNAMFKEFQIAYHWDEEYYDELQNKIGGCVRQMYVGRGRGIWIGLG